MPRVFVTDAAPLIWICIWMLAPRSLLNQTGASLNCGWSLLIESGLGSERERPLGKALAGWQHWSGLSARHWPGDNTGQATQAGTGQLTTLHKPFSKALAGWQHWTSLSARHLPVGNTEQASQNVTDQLATPHRPLGKALAGWQHWTGFSVRQSPVGNIIKHHKRLWRVEATTSKI
jgi:hypothetical protein